MAQAMEKSKTIDGRQPKKIRLVIAATALYGICIDI